MSLSYSYRHLYYFWVVAKEGGLTRAAEKLGLSVQTVSTQVRELEQALGAALLGMCRGITGSLVVTAAVPSEEELESGRVELHQFAVEYAAVRRDAHLHRPKVDRMHLVVERDGVDALDDVDGHAGRGVVAQVLGDAAVEGAGAVGTEEHGDAGLLVSGHAGRNGLRSASIPVRRNFPRT